MYSYNFIQLQHNFQFVQLYNSKVFVKIGSFPSRNEIRQTLVIKVSNMYFTIHKILNLKFSNQEGRVWKMFENAWQPK